MSPPRLPFSVAALLVVVVLLPNPSLAAFASPPSFTAPVKGQYIAHTSRDSSVFVLVRLGTRNAFVVRYDASATIPIWSTSLDDGAVGNAYISLSGARVLAFYQRESDRTMRLLELDANTGQTLVPAADSPLTWGGADGSGEPKSQIYRVGGEITVFQRFFLGAGRVPVSRVLPSGLVLPGVNLNGREVAYVGAGKFAFVTFANGGAGTIQVRVVDAVNGIYEPQIFETPNPGFFPTMDISGGGGFVYFAYVIAQPQDGQLDQFTVVKLAQDTMELQWSRTIAYDIAPPQGDTEPLRFRLDVSARGGVVGVSIAVSTQAGPGAAFAVEGVNLPKPAFAPVDPSASVNAYGDDIVLVTLDDGDGATLSVGNTATIGPEDWSNGGGSMLDGGVYAVVGVMNVTELREPANAQNSFPAEVPTGQMVAFFTQPGFETSTSTQPPVETRVTAPPMTTTTSPSGTQGPTRTQPASPTAGQFGPPAFADPTKGRYLAHVARGEAVFALVRLGRRDAYVVRYDARGGPFVWQRLFAVGYVEDAYISMDGDRVLAWYRRQSDGADGTLRLLEIDAETGEPFGPASDTGFSWGRDFDLRPDGKPHSQIYRVGGEITLIQRWLGSGIPEGGSPGSRLLPSGLVLPNLNPRFTKEISYIGQGRFAFTTLENGVSTIVLRVADAVKGVYEPQRYVVPLPVTSYGSIDMSASGGFVYLAYTFALQTDGSPDLLYVVKLEANTLEVQWTRQISYDITPPGTSLNGLGMRESALRGRLDVSAAGGVCGVSSGFVTAGGPDAMLSVEGVDLPKVVELSSVPSNIVTAYNEDVVVVALDDDDGTTLAVTRSETRGPVTYIGGASMLENNVYALVGLMNVTEFREPANGVFSLPAEVPTGQMAAFFPFSPASPKTPEPTAEPTAEPTDERTAEPTGGECDDESGEPEEIPTLSPAPRPHYKPPHRPHGRDKDYKSRKRYTGKS